jgi:hypothetical protein
LGSYSKENIPSSYKRHLNNKEKTAVCFQESHIKHKSDLSAESKISLVLNLVAHKVSDGHRRVK